MSSFESVYERVTFCRSESLWLKVDHFSDDEIVELLQAIPFCVTRLQMGGHDFSLKSTENIIRMMKAIPSSVTSLEMDSNCLGQSRSKAELAQILRAIPRTVTSLDLSNNDMGAESSLLECRDMMKALPPLLTRLSLGLNDLYLRTVAEVTEIIKVLPVSLIDLFLGTLTCEGDKEDWIKLIKALSPCLKIFSEADALSVGSFSQRDLIEIFSHVPLKLRMDCPLLASDFRDQYKGQHPPHFEYHEALAMLKTRDMFLSDTGRKRKKDNQKKARRLQKKAFALLLKISPKVLGYDDAAKILWPELYAQHLSRPESDVEKPTLLEVAEYALAAKEVEKFFHLHCSSIKIEDADKIDSVDEIKAILNAIEIAQTKAKAESCEPSYPLITKEYLNRLLAPSEIASVAAGSAVVFGSVSSGFKTRGTKRERDPTEDPEDPACE